jgi:hypothetical protein
MFATLIRRLRAAFGGKQAKPTEQATRMPASRHTHIGRAAHRRDNSQHRDAAQQALRANSIIDDGTASRHDCISHSSSGSFFSSSGSCSGSSSSDSCSSSSSD